MYLLMKVDMYVSLHSYRCYITKDTAKYAISQYMHTIIQGETYSFGPPGQYVCEYIPNSCNR